MILALRTDSPTAEIYLVSNYQEIDQLKWLAQRNLADELLIKIEELLKKNNTQLNDLGGIIVFTGEGSFTGLRIGTTVANSIAYALSIPVLASSGKDWILSGAKKLVTAKSNNYVIPQYSAEPNITSPKPKT